MDAASVVFVDILSVASHEVAATWEMALLPGQDARTLPSGDFYGVGVDTGMGAFLDAEGLLELSARFSEEEEAGDDVYGLPPGDCWRADDPDTGAEMVVFSAGYGRRVLPGVDRAERGRPGGQLRRGHDGPRQCGTADLGGSLPGPVCAGRSRNRGPSRGAPGKGCGPQPLH